MNARMAASSTASGVGVGVAVGALVGEAVVSAGVAERAATVVGAGLTKALGDGPTVRAAAGVEEAAGAADAVDETGVPEETSASPLTTTMTSPTARSSGSNEAVLHGGGPLRALPFKVAHQPLVFGRLGDPPDRVVVDAPDDDQGHVLRPLP